MPAEKFNLIVTQDFNITTTMASVRAVTVFGADPDIQRHVKSDIEPAWPTLTALGLTSHGTTDAVSFATKAAAPIQGAGFAQETVPEQLAIKNATFAEIEPVLQADAIVASSASGLMLSQIQVG